MNATSPIQILPGGRKTRRSPRKSRRRCKYGKLKSPRYSNGRRLVCRKSPRRRSTRRSRRRSSPRRRRSTRRSRRRSTRRSRRRSTRRSRRRSSPRRKSRVTRKSQNRCSRHRGARSCGSDPACVWDGKKCSFPRANRKETIFGPMGYASRGLF